MSLPRTCLLNNLILKLCFLFDFVRLKSLVTKQKLRTKFVTFLVKLRNIDFAKYFQSMFYSF